MHRRSWISVALAVAAAILALANIVIYGAIAALFYIDSWAVQIAIGAFLAFASASSILSSVLGRYSYTLFTRLYYTLSMVWMGFLFYFFLASVVYGVALLVPGVPQTALGAACMIAAAALGIYGYFHARQIFVTEITVALPNLPDAWHGRTALWMSDLHLGQLHGASFARRVAERANSIPHDIVFVGGDLFDGTSAPDLRALIAPLKALRAPRGVFFITGNHEEFGDAGEFLAAVRDAGMTTLIDQMISIDGLQLIGVDYHTSSDPERFAATLASFAIDSSAPSILLKHEPRHLDVAAAAGVSLQISGHTHKAQIWPLVYIARLAYQGFEYGLKPLGAMQVYTSSGTGNWGPPLRVGSKGEIVAFTFVCA